MTKQITSLMLMLLWGVVAFSQEIVVEWNFPNESADSIADGGIAENLDKVISTMGGTSALDYKNGITGKAAQATNWDNGTELKCWAVGFSTENYGSLMLSSKMSSGGNDPGPRDFRVGYKVGEGGEWTEVPNSAFETANDWETGVLENLRLPGECTNRPMVYLRWIMTSDTSSAGVLVESIGKIKIDDIVITGTDVSSIGDVDDDMISVFPNPFTDYITLQNTGIAKSCKIMDIAGNVLYSHNIEDGKKINFSNLKEGVYILQLFDKKGNFAFSKKVIKK